MADVDVFGEGLEKTVDTLGANVAAYGYSIGAFCMNYNLNPTEMGDDIDATRLTA